MDYDMLMLYLVFAVLQLFDAITTSEVIKAGGRELNPVLRWVFGRVGTVNGLATIKLALLALVLAVLPWLPFWVLLVLCVAYAGVVVWNLLQYRDMQE